VERSVTDPETERILLEGLAELSLPQDLAAPLGRLCELLGAWAARINLTGHRTPAAIAHRLVLDALAFTAALPLSPPRTLADVGSGAGFPGLPMALCWPDCSVTLVESRERRHHFQRAAVRELGLTNVTATRGRIEELPPTPQDLVVAQALSGPGRALEWMRRWARPGGWVALARAFDAPSIQPPADFVEAQIVQYQVPIGGPRRELWIAQLAACGRDPDDCGR
jgi:16S rRNA (guanine527-N7)-methyltransferase